MFKLHAGFPGLVLTSVLVIGTCASTLSAQSDSELRRENQELSTRVRDLERDLAAARQRIEELEQQTAQLERDLAAARRRATTRPAPPPPPPADPTSIDEGDPLSSPRTLFNAIKQSHDENMDGMEPGRPGDTPRRVYLRRLESWRALVERAFRGRIIWHVRAVDSAPLRRDARRVTLIAVDPVTQAELGNPFHVAITKGMAERLALVESRGELGVLVLRGILGPQIHINEEREERGTFDNPPLIGPFAEFGFVIDARSLVPAKEDAAPSATQPSVPVAPAEKPAEKP